MEEKIVEYNEEKQNHSHTKSVSDNLAIQLEKERADLTTEMNNLVMQIQALKNELIKEKENYCVLTNTFSEEKEKIHSTLKELDAERANVNVMAIELDQAKATVESLKIDITQKETALTEEKMLHNSTKR